MKVEFGKLDFGLENRHYSGVFLVAIAAFIENATIGYSSVYRKRHYREPIVAFLTNATIVSVFQPKVKFAKLDFQKESNLLNNFEHVPCA